MQLNENQISIKTVLNGREYHMVCERNASIGELYDAVMIVRSHVIQVMAGVKTDEPNKVEDNGDQQ